METTELIKKVRAIEIKTKSISNHIFAGDYHSAFKGRGMSFSEVRAYQYGDDVRNIDWNVTARSGETHVKEFEEERELTVMLMVDVSQSAYFGTFEQFKQEMVTELAAVLSFSAIKNNDKVGVIFFTDQIEKYIPPKKGKSHILRIIRELLQLEPKSKGTSINTALQFLNNIIKKKSICFLFSDYLTNENFDQNLKIASRRHDLIGVQIYDAFEKELPEIGVLELQDAETGEYFYIDTLDKKSRELHQQTFIETQERVSDLFIKSGSDFLSVQTKDSYVKVLQQFFKKRAR